MTDNLEPLKDLLTKLFTQDQLRSRLDFFKAGQYKTHFPDPTVSRDIFASRVVDSLQQLGLPVVGEFFLDIAAQRPDQKTEIIKVAEQVLGVDKARRAFRQVTFTWLHLTDLHLGQNGHTTVWPDVEDALFKDLKEVYGVTGPWDVVLFTGDLTQQGAAKEFEALNDVLGELWKLFKELGFSPTLATVPGNHDVQWRNPSDSTVQRLLALHTYSDAYAAFWEDEKSPERKIALEAFESYSVWRNSQPFPQLAELQEGGLPGDFSGIIEKESLRIGIVGLNSTALQLADGKHVPAPAYPNEPFKQRMTLSSGQFHAACGGNGARWCRDLDVALLMTHHPPDWLHPQDFTIYEGSLYPPGRFVAHLFGHMHQHVNRSVAEAGAEAKRFWQGNSLCGLEHYGAHLDRRHGYTVGRLKVERDRGILQLWPRAASRKGNGAWEFGPDTTSTIGMDGATPPVEIRLE